MWRFKNGDVVFWAGGGFVNIIRRCRWRDNGDENSGAPAYEVMMGTSKSTILASQVYEPVTAECLQDLLVRIVVQGINHDLHGRYGYEKHVWGNAATAIDLLARHLWGQWPLPQTTNSRPRPRPSDDIRRN